jgi:hypothetical protein
MIYSSHFWQKTMLRILFIFFNLFICFNAQAQDILTRSFFSIPNNRMYSVSNVTSIDQKVLNLSGSGIHWDFSSIGMESFDLRYVFKQFPDTNPVFSQNTFTVTTQEGGSNTRFFELYSMTEGALLIRGYGFIDELGTRNYESYEKPFPVMRFPWILGERYYEEHPLLANTRTLSGNGRITLPNDITFEAFKVTEFYEDGEFDVYVHSWYADSLPYPLVSVTERLQHSDSTLVSLNGYVINEESHTSIRNQYENQNGIVPYAIGHRIVFPFTHTVLGMYGVRGTIISYESTIENVYVINDMTEMPVMILYSDDKGNVHSHLIMIQK